MAGPDRPEREDNRRLPRSEHFDVVILGTGQGGKLLAWKFARSGKGRRRRAPLGLADVEDRLSPRVPLRSRYGKESGRSGRSPTAGELA